MTRLLQRAKNDGAFPRHRPDLLKDSFVDFDGALVGAFTRRPTHVAVYFPRVVLHMRGSWGAKVRPVVEAEIRLWDATVEQAPRRLPRRLSNWEIRYRGERRSGTLPLGFAASGSVRLTVEFARDDPLTVTGSRVTLRILKRVSQLAAPSSKKPKPDRRRPRSESARRP